MTIHSPHNEPDGPPTSLGATETEGHKQQPDDTAVSGPRRLAHARTSTWNAIYRDFLLEAAHLHVNLHQKKICTDLSERLSIAHIQC